MNKEIKQSESPNNGDSGYREIAICYVKQFEGETPDDFVWSGYIKHFLTKEDIFDAPQFKLNGPLLATTLLEMPFETLEYCLFALMNLLRTNVIHYTLQDEKELIETNGTLNLIQVTREEIIPGFNKLIESETNG